MKKIFKPIVVAIFKIDTTLYKTFGLVTSLRRQFWAYCGQRLQQDLDREHSRRDMINSIFGHDYTTKRALEVYFQDEVYSYNDEVSPMEW